MAAGPPAAADPAPQPAAPPPGLVPIDLVDIPQDPEEEAGVWDDDEEGDSEDAPDEPDVPVDAAARRINQTVHLAQDYTRLVGGVDAWVVHEDLTIIAAGGTAGVAREAPS